MWSHRCGSHAVHAPKHSSCRMGQRPGAHLPHEAASLAAALAVAQQEPSPNIMRTALPAPGACKHALRIRQPAACSCKHGCTLHALHDGAFHRSCAQGCSRPSLGRTVLCDIHVAAQSGPHHCPWCPWFLGGPCGHHSSLVLSIDVTLSRAGWFLQGCMSPGSAAAQDGEEGRT